MEPEDLFEATTQIRCLLQTINDSWLGGDPSRPAKILPRCFDPDIAIKGPAFQPVASGKDACIQSYTEFLQQAQIKSCELAEPTIDVAGDTAVATYGWTMTYRLGDQEYTESGHDLFVFGRSEGKWLATSRTMLPALVSP